MTRIAGIRFGVAAAAIVAVVATWLVYTPSAHAEAAPPAGMTNYTVAVGRVDAQVRTNWQRLATYEFAEDGTVTEEHWHWSQSRRVVRTYTGVQARDCPARDCNVQTAGGYQSANAPQALSGTYSVTGDTVRIEWDIDQWEEWRISEPIDGKLARLSFSDSNFGATHGFGYGSRAELDDRASMADIEQVDHGELKHRFYFWKTENGRPIVDIGFSSQFWMTDWELCGSGACLSGESSTPTEYYIVDPNSSTTDRRDTLWHWQRALADGRGEYCYTGNSHVKPMMQIIDSDGGFHGWVGIEASLSQTSSGTDADDVGVFEISRFAE